MVNVTPRCRTLSGFMKAVTRTNGLSLADVTPLTTFVVRTTNSVYRITVLRAPTREVLVQGGRCYAEPTRACLSGSSGGGSCLKLGWIGIGRHLEFHANDQWVITSHVRSVAIEPTPLLC